MKALAFAPLALLAALAAAAPFAGARAAGNVCVTPHLSCITTMPVNGFCQCVASGATESGTVAPPPPGPTNLNSTAGGCGAQPNAPGCKPPAQQRP